MNVVGKELQLLTSLALAAGRPVSPDVLADRLWDGEAGDAWRPTLHTYVTRLRRRLEAVGVPRSRLRQRGKGYVLDLTDDSVDWLEFSALRSRAAAYLRREDSDAGVDLLETALDLWQGDPLGGLPGRWAGEMRTSMTSAHQAVLGKWASAALRQGRGEDVVETLGAASVEYPLNEALSGHLMRALALLDRSADALLEFQRIRRRLAEETGSDPSPHLVRLNQEILRRSERGEASRSNGHAGSTVRTVEAPPLRTNLPRDLADFADRTRELDLLLGALKPAEPSQAANVCVISGMPGVGKTSLVVRAAHRLAGEFGDGSWVVDLRGHDENQEPVGALEALGQLLELVGVPMERTGDTVHQRMAVWRDHTSHRRILLLLDDAASAEQVAPLLPSGPGCAVLITSRNQLADIDGAFHLRLREPRTEEAVTVFTTIARHQSSHEVDYTTTEIADLVRLCGNLPLALRLIATRLTTGGEWTASAIIHRLRSAKDTLREFRVGYRQLAVVFPLSLRSLSRTAHDAFLRLGLHPHLTIDLHAGAALAGLEPERAEEVFEELVGASLLETGAAAGTYRAHALVMDFARGRAREELPAPERESATLRMLDAYLRGCSQADRTLYPHRMRQEHLLAPAASTEAHPLTSRDAAFAWLSTRIPAVLAVIGHAAQGPHAWYAAALTHAIAEHIDAHGPWDVRVDLHRQALDIWQARGEERDVAQASYELARALWRSGAVREADERVGTARRLWRNAGDIAGEARALDQQGVIAFVTGRHAAGAELHQRAQELFERVGDERGIALSMDRRGACHFRSGAFHDAIAAHSDALRIQERLGDVNASVATKTHLAGALQALGYHRESTALCQEALAGARELGDRRREGVILGNLAEVLSYRGRHHEALAHFRTALEIHHEVKDPWTEAMALSNIGRLHLAQDHFDEAEECFTRCQKLCATYVNPAANIESKIGLGDLEHRRGNLALAHELASEALNDAEHFALADERAQSLTLLGRVMIDQGARNAARTTLESAEQQYMDLDSPQVAYVRALIEGLIRIA